MAQLSLTSFSKMLRLVYFEWSKGYTALDAFGSTMHHVGRAIHTKAVAESGGCIHCWVGPNEPCEADDDGNAICPDRLNPGQVYVWHRPETNRNETWRKVIPNG